MRVLCKLGRLTLHRVPEWMLKSDCQPPCHTAPLLAAPLQVILISSSNLETKVPLLGVQVQRALRGLSDAPSGSAIFLLPLLLGSEVRLCGRGGARMGNSRTSANACVAACTPSSSPSSSVVASHSLIVFCLMTMGGAATANRSRLRFQWLSAPVPFSTFSMFRRDRHPASICMVE